MKKNRSNGDSRGSRFSKSPYGMLAGCLLVIAWLAPGARGAPSIFDDNWMPPQRDVPSQPKPTPAAPTTGPVAAEPPPASTAPPVPRPGALGGRLPAGGPARRVVPTKGEAAAARKQMREVYAKELAGRGAAARKAFARALIDDAARAAGAPIDRYVLLGGAYEAAKEGQDARLCIEAADVLAKEYEVDGRAMKLAALSVAGRGGDAEEAKAVVVEGQALIEAAVADDDYDAVRKAATAVEQAAARTKDPAIAAEVRAPLKAARALADDYGRIQKDVATLVAQPDDPAANLAVGRFLTLGKGDWARGLLALAKSADPVLAPLARQDIAAPTAPAEQAKLGDAWLAVADKQADLKAAAQARAGYWYSQALPGLEGLTKLTVLKRMRQLPPRIAFDQLAQRIEAGVESTGRSGGGPAGGPNEKVPSPGLLVGFDYTLTEFGNRPIIRSLRPIYLTSKGKVKGNVYGKPGKEWLTVEAKPGHAVGTVVTDGTDRLNGFKITFMPVRGALLDAGGAYESTWIGGHAAKRTDTLGAEGRPVVGVQVTSGTDVDALGLILAQ